jgi:hypothetical protein
LLIHSQFLLHTFVMRVKAARDMLEISCYVKTLTLQKMHSNKLCRAQKKFFLVRTASKNDKFRGETQIVLNKKRILKLKCLEFVLKIKLVIAARLKTFLSKKIF